MNTKSILVLVLISNVYSHTYEEEDNKVVLWYPIPLLYQQLQELISDSNFTNCQRHVLEKVISDKLISPIDNQHNSNTPQYVISTKPLSTAIPLETLRERKPAADFEVRILSDSNKNDVQGEDVNLATKAADAWNESVWYSYTLPNTNQAKHSDHQHKVGKLKDDYSYIWESINNNSRDIGQGEKIASDFVEIRPNATSHTVKLNQVINEPILDHERRDEDLHSRPLGHSTEISHSQLHKNEPDGNHSHMHLNKPSDDKLHLLLLEYLRNQTPEQQNRCNCTSLLTKLLNRYIDESNP